TSTQVARSCYPLREINEKVHRQSYAEVCYRNAGNVGGHPACHQFGCSRPIEGILNPSSLGQAPLTRTAQHRSTERPVPARRRNGARGRSGVAHLTYVPLGVLQRDKD